MFALVTTIPPCGNRGAPKLDINRTGAPGGSDAAVAPDRDFYAAVSWAAFNTLSCPPSAHLEKKI
jgi:hypothetical protein